MRTRIPAITRRCPDHWTVDTVNCGRNRARTDDCRFSVGRFTVNIILPHKMVAAAGFDTRNLQVLSNQYPGGPLPDKGAELDKGRPLLLPLLGLRCVIFV